MIRSRLILFAASISDGSSVAATDTNNADLFGINANYKLGDKTSTVVEAYTFVKLDKTPWKVVKVKTYGWDGQNRLSSIELKDGEGCTFWKKSFEEYDSFNNPQKEASSEISLGQAKTKPIQ